MCTCDIRMGDFTWENGGKSPFYGDIKEKIKSIHRTALEQYENVIIQLSKGPAFNSPQTQIKGEPISMYIS